MSSVNLKISKSDSKVLSHWNWFLWPVYILFFMMVFAPTIYKPFKAVLIGLVMGLIVCHPLFNRRSFLHRTIFLWVLVMATTGLGFMLLGLINGAEWGAILAGKVYFLYPLLYAVLVMGIAKENVIDGLFKVLVAAALAIGLHSLSYILNSAGWLPDALYLKIDVEQEIGFYSGFMEYYLRSMVSLFFLIPFLFAALLTWPKQSRMPVGRLWLWFALFLDVASAFLSGRRGLWLIVILAPLFALVFRMFLTREQRSANSKVVVRVLLAGVLTIVGLFTYLQFVVGLDIQAMAEWFALGFYHEVDESAFVRREQFLVLLQEWSRSPLFGMGHGATALGFQRSETVPWAYELSYVALLFHTGIVGVLIYSAGVAWIVWMGVKIMRSGDRMGLYILPVLAGMSCFLIGNATNPYLEKFDFVWVIFLPIGLINFWLLRCYRDQRGGSYSIS